MSGLGRARGNVVKRVRSQAQEELLLGRRTLSQRSMGLGQPLSPVSPALKPVENNAEVEVIDVDALPDDNSQSKTWRMIGSKQDGLQLESRPTFVACMLGRSRSC